MDKNPLSALWNWLCGLAASLLGNGKGAPQGAPATPTGGPATPPSPPPPSFLAEVNAAEAATPLPPPDDPQFAAAAKARGGAVAGVVSKWLGTAPYALFAELLAQPKDQLPLFKPVIGPVIVMRHPDVITCLERTDLFTVDPYAGEMARAADDPQKHPGAYSHFMLGTDRDDLYRLDDVILRKAVAPGDLDRLLDMARAETERLADAARPAGEIDVVPTVATLVPLRIVSDYLGVHFYGPGEDSVLPGLKGGDTFPLDEDLQQVFTFTKITQGIVPTSDQLVGWVRDAFRNIFNNFSPASPLFGQFREQGIVATESLSLWVHVLLEHYKARLLAGEVVPDTLLTRLLKMQLEVAQDPGPLEDYCASLLGAPLPEGELARRLSDSMIRSNVFGTAVGAVVNPQEATGRMVDAMLRLKDGEYAVPHGSDYAQAVGWAQTAPDDPAYAEHLAGLRRYALEALRLKPQGEVLLRLCVKDNDALSGVPIRKGTLVFAAYAAAMRDPDVVENPLAFDITRDERLEPYLAGQERRHEAPQSLIYLQHGYGRHKCLGRYASEITLQESLRALLRLGEWRRLSELQMDAQGLYAVSLRVGF